MCNIRRLERDGVKKSLDVCRHVLRFDVYEGEITRHARCVSLMLPFLAVKRYLVRCVPKSGRRAMLRSVRVHDHISLATWFVGQPAPPLRQCMRLWPAAHRSDTAHLRTSALHQCQSSDLCLSFSVLCGSGQGAPSCVPAALLCKTVRCDP